MLPSPALLTGLERGIFWYPSATMALRALAVMKCCHVRRWILAFYLCIRNLGECMARMRTRSGMTAIKLWMTDELLAKLTEEAKATGTARQTLISSAKCPGPGRLKLEVRGRRLSV